MNVVPKFKTVKFIFFVRINKYKQNNFFYQFLEIFFFQWKRKTPALPRRYAAVLSAGVVKKSGYDTVHEICRQRKLSGGAYEFEELPVWETGLAQLLCL